MKELVEMTEKTLATIVGLKASNGPPALVSALADTATIGVSDISNKNVVVTTNTHLHDVQTAGGIINWLSQI